MLTLADLAAARAAALASDIDPRSLRVILACLDAAAPAPFVFRCIAARSPATWIVGPTTLRSAKAGIRWLHIVLRYRHGDEHLLAPTKACGDARLKAIKSAGRWLRAKGAPQLHDLAQRVVVRDGAVVLDDEGEHLANQLRIDF
jgi:hypothetical protein